MSNNFRGFSTQQLVDALREEAQGRERLTAYDDTSDLLREAANQLESLRSQVFDLQEQLWEGEIA